ncbi:IS3 family transposase [Nocardiopsis aegyptia]|uniref:Transposase InsO family protein n=1 Tax=Nocardiopsis aegyptia TaxID=220378 RepID=A0A7Z0ETL3_9ACTN|nr:transposase InsO family protein [Nocardiopsis aegyptia]
MARDLDISTETIYAWRCQDRIDQGLAPGLTSTEKTELAAANKRIAELEVELLDRRRWRTRLELANAIFEYLEIFHNRQRRHSAIGWLTPLEFENKQPSTVA